MSPRVVVAVGAATARFPCATRPYPASRILDTTQIRRLIAFSSATDVTLQRFNVREAICQMLDQIAFPFPANLSLARVRRQKNHSGKLRSADGQLEHDGSIKEPENARS
jgi:hypothetical protein